MKRGGRCDLIYRIFDAATARGPTGGHKLGKDVREGSELVARAWCKYSEARLTWQERQVVEQMVGTFQDPHEGLLATTIVCSGCVAGSAGTVRNSVVGEGKEKGSEEGCGANLRVRNKRQRARGAAIGDTASSRCHRSSQPQP